MARMTISGFDSTLKMLDKMGSMVGPVAEEAVRAGADLLADDVRRRLEGSLAFSKNKTGDLERSFGVTKPRLNNDGSIDVKIGFHGYDRKRVSNQLKARVREKGSSRGQKPRPFFGPAVKANRKKIKELMERVVYANYERIAKE